MNSTWRYLGASVPGSDHQSKDEPCEDAFSILGLGEESAQAPILLVASDGAGSAEQGGAGARLLCDLIAEQASGYVQAGGSCPDADSISSWLDRAASKLAFQAEGTGHEIRDYACTLLVGFLGPDESVFAQLGDGAIIAADQEFEAVFWPQTGEYVNSTFFVTDEEHRSRLEIRTTQSVPRVAVLTDGLQMLALEYANRSVHSPFFEPMFRRLEQEPPGRAESLEPELIDFLQSPSVNARTGDDKTLILATKRSAPEETQADGDVDRLPPPARVD